MTKQGNTLVRFLRNAAFMLLPALLIAPTFSVGAASSQQSRGWRVWIKTSPCSGRFDWLSVAQNNPSGGINSYVPYETFIGGRACTQPAPNGCTFAEAQALMSSLRGNSKFLDFCCRDYSVWQNTTTRRYTVVLGKTGTPGMGWQFVKGNLCCEEAEALAGIPGACSGSSGGGGGGWGPINYNASINQGDGKVLTYYRGTTAEQCKADCEKNPQCVAFTLIRAGAYSPNDPVMCYLLSEAKKMTASTCCISAIKNKSGGKDNCACKDRCPDCAGLPSLLCVVEGESAKARACRQCMSRCQ